MFMETNNATVSVPSDNWLRNGTWYARRAFTRHGRDYVTISRFSNATGALEAIELYTSRDGIETYRGLISHDNDHTHGLFPSTIAAALRVAAHHVNDLY